MDINEKVWLTVEETALYLGRTQKAIYQLGHKRILPSYKINKSLYFKRKEIDQMLLASRRTNPEIS